MGWALARRSVRATRAEMTKPVLLPTFHARAYSFSSRFTSANGLKASVERNDQETDQEPAFNWVKDQKIRNRTQETKERMIRMLKRYLSMRTRMISAFGASTRVVAIELC